MSIADVDVWLAELLVPDLDADPGWECETHLQGDVARFLTEYHGWTVRQGVRVPGAGTADLLVDRSEDGHRPVVVEVKVPRSISQVCAAAGQVSAYREGLGGGWVAAVLVEGGRWNKPLINRSFAQLGVELWEAFPLFGVCDDVEFCGAEFWAESVA